MRPFGVQTFFSQQKRVEGHVVDAEVEEALPRHPALPAAAGVERHQLLWWREAEVQLKLQKGFPELFWILLLGGLTPPNLLCDEALHRTSPEAYTLSGFWFKHGRGSNLDFSFDKAGSILFVLKNRQRLEQVVDQPVPVLVHLLYGGSCWMKWQEKRVKCSRMAITDRKW